MLLSCIALPTCLFSKHLQITFFSYIRAPSSTSYDGGGRVPLSGWGFHTPFNSKLNKKDLYCLHLYIQYPHLHILSVIDTTVE